MNAPRSAQRLLFSLRNFPSRHPSDDSPGLDGPSDDGSGAHDSVTAYRYASDDHDIGPKPNIVSDDDPAAAVALLVYGPLDGGEDMVAGPQDGIRANEDVVADGD